MLLDFLSEKKRQPAECVIRVDGEEITDLYPFLSEVTVDSSRTQATEATLIFETRRHEDGGWVVQDDGRFVPWAAILIEAQFGDDSEEVMRGYVREVSADYPNEAGSARVTVKCQDESLPLDREHIRKAWGADAPTTDRAIVEEILGGHGLSLHRDSLAGQSDLVVNQDEPDIRFLQRRAGANGYELLFAAGEVYFGTMRLSASAQDTIMVYAGRDTNCLSFSVRDDGHQPDSVAYEIAAETGSQAEVQVVEPDLDLLGKTAANSSGSGLRDFTWRMSRQGVSDPTEMAARAQAKANEQSMKIKASGELDGSLYGHVLRVGEPVGVDGIGDIYGGIYYVDSVSHRFDTSGYRQTFNLLRNATGDNLESAGGLLSGLI